MQKKYLELIQKGARLTGVLDLKEALFLITESAANLTNSEGGSVLLLDSKGNRLHFAVATGPSGPKLVNKSISIKKGLAGWVVRNRKPVISNQPETDKRHTNSIDNQMDFQTRTILAVPLFVKDEIIGVLEAVNHKAGEYTKDQLEILTYFAELAAMVIQNARKFESLKNTNRLHHENDSLKHSLIGQSDDILRIRQTIERIAIRPVSVLITGESGTGKEVVAWQIHNRSNSKDKPFVKVSCAALNENLLESELFGHEKGAFTGATSRHIGKFERARGGTILLDEIGEISERVQVKLLRVLQENEIERVGGKETIPVDVRIISATNRNIREEIQKGNFREDLYYRIKVMQINIKPLREKTEDIPLLCKHILEKLRIEFDHTIRKISNEAMEILKKHDFPGNIRELENVLERAAVLSQSPILTPDLLPVEIIESKKPDPEQQFSEMTLPEIEKKKLVNALKKTGGNKSKAARELGISRDKLRYRLKKYDIK